MTGYLSRFANHVGAVVFNYQLRRVGLLSVTFIGQKTGL
jgi:hypothetical protein